MSSIANLTFKDNPNPFLNWFNTATFRPFKSGHSADDLAKLLLEKYPPGPGFVLQVWSRSYRNGQASGGGGQSRVYEVFEVSYEGRVFLTVIEGESAFKGTDFPVLGSLWASPKVQPAYKTFGAIVRGQTISFFEKNSHNCILPLGFRGYDKLEFSLENDKFAIDRFLTEIKGWVLMPAQGAMSILETKNAWALCR
ncbi:uncharacterized protein BO97DRAFT_429461 [Aspergillus homomorphus CBS 101889]|uniref:Uncharacterized protein n=1 Tax=Aspergillus homomorphus (strain CBS 101889) TaxID=1450537 RepID=A0A395HH60_ASPHC|nr:hypothetical protein BO97DRAFT_429461 [Aspergillus homomorphus CBS 101889]RAL07252.1 hypothetical protein BO97DRAFT_429461 [Aspergillus homomorphus CBS 101889]